MGIAAPGTVEPDGVAEVASIAWEDGSPPAR